MVQPTGTSSKGADPIEAPRAPEATAPRRRRVNWRKWRARFLVLLLLAAAVLLFMRISSARATESQRVSLDKVTLTAQAIPVEPARTGQVTSVSVTALQPVTQGQRVGTMDVAGIDRNGDPKTTRVSLTAPRSGIVIDLPAAIGTTLQPGQPFLQLYDPAQMTFVSDVPVKNLPDIAPSMTAALRSDGMNRTVHATVQRIVPRVQGASTSGTSAGALQVVLVPQSPSEVRGLVPGLIFTGYIDTATGSKDITRLVSLPQLRS
ncbi:HlyD family efflux transporter periplasmic adaptor subunit [Actinoplanes sp. CA-030573]|uniref:HlyD family efflux transporter periplasmic adaptor subunit n=1 Tax=Actinoplanes sp. CA-030573 TaxID=3239898 RepID=UPI003D92E6AF